MMSQHGVAKAMFSLFLGLLIQLLPAGAYADEADEEQWPFVAIIQGNLNLMPTNDPCVFLNEDTGKGFATHMGRISATTMESIDFCSSAPDVVVVGEFVLENADGAALSCAYETLGTPVPDSPEIRSFGRYECPDGEGRFALCSGRGLIAAQGSLLPPFEVGLALAGKLSCWEL